MNVVDRIHAAHAGRDPERLSRKWDLLETNANSFFRGTAFLFYQDLGRERTQLPDSPSGWICGDAHVENFGVYKGANRLVYFDYNDFDEAALAPVLWELSRYATSLLLCGKDLQMPMPARQQIVKDALTEYAASLAAGKAYWVERATSTGPVRQLMVGLKARSRKQLLDKRAPLKKKQRRIALDGEHALPLAPGEREMLERICAGLTGNRPGFFRLIDAARRIAGNGSLGIDRYVLLVEGKGSPDHNFLLDLKAQRQSVVAAELPDLQPNWANEADRMLAIQHMMQAVSPAFLHAITSGDRCFVMKELMPREDRIRMGISVKNAADLAFMARQEARLMAWGQLRSASRLGSATIDDLQRFARDPDWKAPLLAYAKMAAARMAEYRKAWRARS